MSCKSCACWLNSPGCLGWLAAARHARVADTHGVEQHDYLSHERCDTTLPYRTERRQSRRSCVGGRTGWMWWVREWMDGCVDGRVDGWTND